MNKKLLFFFFIAVVLVLLVGFVYFGKGPNDVLSFNDCVSAGYPVMESYPRRCAVPNGQTFTEDIGNILEKTDLIRLSSPTPGETVSSPLSISGEARGYWFFEASAPVEILDSAGKILGVGYVTTIGEWMTEEFVQFAGELVFDNPGVGTGKLVLKKDNPSGLPEHDDMIYFPVNFGNEE